MNSSCEMRKSIAEAENAKRTHRHESRERQMNVLQIQSQASKSTLIVYICSIVLLAPLFSSAAFAQSANRQNSAPAISRNSPTASSGESSSEELLDLDDQPSNKNDSAKSPAEARDRSGQKISRPSAAQPNLTQLSKTAPDGLTPNNGQTLKSMMTEAAQLEKKGEMASVIKLLRPQIDQLPREGLLLLARAHSRQGDFASQARVLELCLAKNPKDHVVQTLLGEAYGNNKRWEDALTSFTSAREIKPDYRPAYDGLLRGFEATDNRFEARSLLADMIKRFGPEPKLHSLLCRFFSLDDFLEKAIEVCELAVAKSPREPENYVHLAISLRDSEQEERAGRILDQAAKKFPNSERVQSTAGEFKLHAKNFSAAYRHFRQGVTANASSAKAQLGLANSAFALQKNDEALQAFVRACQLDRKLGKEFRIAAKKLRDRGDSSWATRFESGIEKCE